MHRNTKNDMTFDRADRMEMNKSKKLIEFFSECKSNLFHYGLEDEAFYFEQMEDWLKQGKPIPTTEEQTIKALGV